MSHFPLAKQKLEWELNSYYPVFIHLIQKVITVISSATYSYSTIILSTLQNLLLYSSCNKITEIKK